MPNSFPTFKVIRLEISLIINDTFRLFQGVMSKSINWDLLAQQYYSNPEFGALLGKTVVPCIKKENQTQNRKY